jgi:PilZ domain
MIFPPHTDDDSSLPSSSTDRRQHPRQPIIPRLYVILDAAKTDGILNDVSETGVALDIVGPAPQDDFIAVDFEMSEIGQRFEARGRIMWRDDATKKLGVHFDDLPEASRTQIRKWLAKKSPAAPTPVASAPAAAPTQEAPKATPAIAASATATPTIAATVPSAAPTMDPLSDSPALPVITAPVAEMPARDSFPTAPPVPMTLPTAAPGPAHTKPPQPSAPPKLETLKSYEVITGTHSESEHGVVNIPPAPVAQPAAPAAPEALTTEKEEAERDRIAENLLQSFSPPSSAQTIRDSFVKTGPPSIFSAAQSSAATRGRNWVAITVVVAMVLLLALGFLTYRSVARNALSASPKPDCLPTFPQTPQVPTALPPATVLAVPTPMQLPRRILPQAPRTALIPPACRSDPPAIKSASFCGPKKKRLNPSSTPTPKI